MRSVVAIAAVFLALLILAPQAEAQRVTQWGVRGGVYFDETEPFIGAEALMPLARNWFFNPNIEHAFGDQNLTTLNADVHYDLPTRDRNFIWVGAGLAGLLGDDSDLGLNVLVGYGLRRGSVTPYVQLKGILSDNNQVVLGGGIRF
jgi:hypothetical protein